MAYRPAKFRGPLPCVPSFNWDSTVLCTGPIFLSEARARGCRELRGREIICASSLRPSEFGLWGLKRLLRGLPLPQFAKSVECLSREARSKV